jgi:hypothetical protein
MLIRNCLLNSTQCTKLLMLAPDHHIKFAKDEAARLISQMGFYAESQKYGKSVSLSLPEPGELRNKYFSDSLNASERRSISF